MSRHFHEAVDFLINNKRAFFTFCFVLFGMDVLSYIFQTSFVNGEEESRVVEIIFQVGLLYFTVVLLHYLALCHQKEKKAFGPLLINSLLLTPGYFLQVLLLFVAVTLGGFLLILPGIYAFIAFYFAPVLAVVYPDYRGKVFLLSRELFAYDLSSFIQTLFAILIGGILPFIPEVTLWVSTGQMKSIWSLIFAPIDGFIYVFFNVFIFYFVWQRVENHRGGVALATPNKSS